MTMPIDTHAMARTSPPIACPRRCAGPLAGIHVQPSASVSRGMISSRPYWEGLYLINKPALVSVPRSPATSRRGGWDCA